MKKRFLSLILVLAMMVGVFTPLIANAADEAVKKEGAPVDAAESSTTSTIDIHKIVMKASVFEDWKPEENRTNGGKIQKDDIEKFFGAKSKEVAGVVFEIYKEVDAGTAGAVTGEDLNKLYPSDQIDTKKAYQKVGEDHKTEAEGTGNIDLTEFLDKDGDKVKETKFIIVENLEKSKYEEKDEKGNVKTLNKNGKAIPAAIVLPATIMGGNVLHLYPKNTDTEKPEVVKDYKDQFEENKANDKLNNKRDQDTINKDEKDHQIGDNLEYRVETLFKENTSYKTAYWEDNMTEGLTYNKDVKVYIDGKEADAADYKIEKNESNDTYNGFYVSLTEKGLEKVNGPEKHLVALEYSATLNEKAIVNIPETNDVDFFYGNDKKQGNTPKTTKPVDKKITVKKTWDDGKFSNGESATFVLIDASTGEVVDGSKVTIGKDKDKTNLTETHTWDKLDNEKSYRVEEIERTDGEEVSYTLDSQGNISVVNHKGNNKEINPKEPKVVHHGKKFVKVDEKTNKRLAGAEFVVMNSDKTKYLAQKSEAETANDRQVYTEAKAIYDQMVADKVEQTEIDAQYKKVEDAYKKLNTKYEWVESQKPAEDKTLVKLVSNENGQFAIDGLADGTYYLKETKAPDGYAEIKEAKEFTISANSWASEGNIEFRQDEEGNEGIAKTGEKATSAMKVGNRNLTIPQTGGIGTVIFTAIGLAIMASAIIAIKKRQATEAR
ncbi:isopeptide-forming domain-containing fimbrial protein [Finegoldia magna]|uniref:isopeptide-forming domain-containing fimbrial protein n=1 Tax=Finegoldia magna TaxID=1260 RepID=UPI002902B5DC|nr:isopeptide-forming domain-containing fimbrial protein [Finegoldia magna]MDU1580051.1 isopeptide-forming domain-containing fimbrial protein [Finegoldia magna]MDU1600814.1 isopeptide-forming domain-containing fimbrial protein [Finegoldia magna]